MKFFPYHIYGSETSRDLDIVIFVDYIPPDTTQRIVFQKKYFKQAKEFFNKAGIRKKVDAILGVVKDGVLKDTTGSGLIEIINNTIYHSYGFHNQAYPLMIKKELPVDIDRKIKYAVLRIYKEIVKNKLTRGLVDYSNPLPQIKNFDFTKSYLRADYSCICFEICHSLAISKGYIKLYTKDELAELFPDLNNVLCNIRNISKKDLRNLEIYKDKFLKLCYERILEKSKIIQSA